MSLATSPVAPAGVTPAADSHARAGQRIVSLNPLGDSAWDQKIADLPGASFFHRSAWTRVLHDTYGYQPVYFVRPEGTKYTAALPMMEVDSWATGRRGVSLPFTDLCEPIGSSSVDLIDAVMTHARERNWKSCEFRGGRPGNGHAVASNSYFGHTLDLRHDESALFAMASSATRRAVRKAQKSSVTIQFAHSPESVREFYGLLCETRRRLGVPPQPFSFFANIQRHVLATGQGCVVLARHDGKAIAGAVFFHAGKIALYKFGASTEAMQHLRGNNLVMWSAIEWHAKMGFETLDFGRTSVSNEGLRDYKLSWGATEHTINYYKYDLRQRAFVTQRDQAEGGWHNRIFRNSPICASRLIGSMLYKHIA